MEHFLRAIGVASGFWNGSVFGGLDPYGAKSLPNAFSAPLLPDAHFWLDATDVKVRRDHPIVSVVVILAVGVNTDGRREVLGGAGQGSGRAAAGIPAEG